MIRYFCDRCQTQVSSSTNSIRLESLVSGIGTKGIGLEILLLFNGGLSQTNHLCSRCVADLLFLGVQSLTVEDRAKAPVSIKHLLDGKQRLEDELGKVSFTNQRLVGEVESLRKQLNSLKDEHKKVTESVASVRLEQGEVKSKGEKTNLKLISKLTDVERTKEELEKKNLELTEQVQELLDYKQKAAIRLKIVEQDLQGTKVALEQRTKELLDAQAQGQTR